MPPTAKAAAAALLAAIDAGGVTADNAVASIQQAGGLASIAIYIYLNS